MPLQIVHQDPELYVIDKPAGLVVHPGAGNRAHTLQNGLLALDPTLTHVRALGLVHRLDKDTSGLLIVARTPEAHACSWRSWRHERSAASTWRWCWAGPTGGARIEEPIGRHRSARTRMAVRADVRTAITHLPHRGALPCPYLAAGQARDRPHHQIRVHLSHAGFPIVGDRTYGGRALWWRQCSGAAGGAAGVPAPSVARRSDCA